MRGEPPEHADFISGKRLLVRTVKRSGLEVDDKSVGLKRSAGVTGEGEQTIRRWEWAGWGNRGLGTTYHIFSIPQFM